MSRRTMITLAAAAMFVAGAQAVGVGIFVDNAEGAFLQSPTAGPVCSLLPGSDPEATACALDPVAASASAAALLHAQPVAHVDAEASSKVEALLAPDALARPGAVLNVHLAGISPESVLGSSAGAASVAGPLPHAVRHVADSEAVHAAVAALSCAAVRSADLTADCPAERPTDHLADEALASELAAAAGATLTADGFTFAPGPTLPGGQSDGGTYTLPREGGGEEVEALLRELTCFLGNARTALEEGDAGTRMGPGGATVTTRLFNARLERSAGVRAAFGAASREAEAAARLTAGAAKAAVARAHAARGSKVVSLVTLPDAAQVDAIVSAAGGRRRALLAEEHLGFSPLTPSQKFRNVAVASVVGVVVFVIAACGILALMTMSFPSDSLLYPRDKND